MLHNDAVRAGRCYCPCHKGDRDSCYCHGQRRAAIPPRPPRRMWTVTIRDENQQVVESHNIDMNLFEPHHLTDAERALLYVAPDQCPYDCGHCD